METTILEQQSGQSLAQSILTDLMGFRRMAAGSTCAPDCLHCQAPHLRKIMEFIDSETPITFILPAFPGKSPNHSKVLGHLPDLAEVRALEFLQTFCERVKRVYAPGARLILCSDGRVFSDAVGLNEDHVSEYQKEITRIIHDLDLHHLSTFDLDDVFPALSFDQMRETLMERHGKDAASLRHQVQEDADMKRLYCGITRFLFEDSLTPGQLRSRASLQKESRSRAYEVIRRSNAWSDLLETIFPDHVRLSIHPQSCGSKKMGIRLLEAESWMTPWHGVALEQDGVVKLVKRAEAEAMGAVLVHRQGIPSHFVVPTFKLAPITPFGVTVFSEHSDQDIKTVPVEFLKTLFHQHQLVVLRGFRTFVSSEEFATYCESWGEIALWPFGKVLELQEQETPEDHIFDHRYVPLHWDGMYRPEVPEFQIFHCVKAPGKEAGGRTTFSHSARALSSASEEERSLWKKVTGVYQRKMEFYDSKTRSPIVVKHPYKDVSVIRYNEPPRGDFLNPPNLCFEGISQEDQETFHRSLQSALTSPEAFYAHEWVQGDVVIADNFTLLHGREGFQSKSPRHLQRIHVHGARPFKNPGLESYQ